MEGSAQMRRRSALARASTTATVLVRTTPACVHVTSTVACIEVSVVGSTNGSRHATLAVLYQNSTPIEIASNLSLEYQ